MLILQLTMTNASILLAEYTKVLEETDIPVG